MKRAWGQTYGAISEIKTNLFLATFKTHDHMLNVWKRQPWSIGHRDLLLLENFDSSKDIFEYKL